MNKHVTKKILVIAAHPDDEVLGCGATVALRVSQGWEAHLLIMTRGVEGRKSDISITTKAELLKNQLSEEMQAAARVVGFKSVEQLAFPDNRMDTISRMDVVDEIKIRMEKIRPDIVFTHHPGDYNWDHTITFDAVLMAGRHSPGEWAPEELYTFEVPSSTERGFAGAGASFNPNTYVDVSRSIDKKKLALTHYKSELRIYPHPRSIEALEYLSRKRGYEVGIEYAEAFELVRKVERRR